jgi:hypothetical protein
MGANMKYTGGCHCGAVRFEVEMAIDKAISCNCSICTKRGHLLAFAPDQNFKLLRGEEALTDYQFGKKSIHHYFCKICGVGAFGKGAMPDGTLMRAINIHCLDNVNAEQFTVMPYDGKSL